MTRILVPEAIHAEALALLAGAGAKVVTSGPLAEADAVIVRTRRITAEELSGSPGSGRAGRLRVISKHGVGVDNIPLQAARAAGITVTNTPGANARAVAEHALALMLALAKGLPAQMAAARSDGRPSPRVRAVELAGRRLLVVGFGATGRRVAALAAALGMRVTVLSRSLQVTTLPEGYRVALDLESALPEADVITLHCPLTEATRGLLGAAQLALLPRGALVINCARGGVIDEAALLAADHLGGFALDVVAEEPIAPDSPLLSARNGIVTPHSAALSEEAFRRMGLLAAENALAALEGRADPACVVVAPRPAVAEGGA